MRPGFRGGAAIRRGFGRDRIEAGANLAIALEMGGVLGLQLDQFLVGVAGALELVHLHTGVGEQFQNLGDHGVFAGALEEVVEGLQGLGIVAHPGDGAVQMGQHILFIVGQHLGGEFVVEGEAPRVSLSL